MVLGDACTYFVTCKPAFEQNRMTKLAAPKHGILMAFDDQQYIAAVSNQWELYMVTADAQKRYLI
jgi:hypothetical protein